MKIDVPKIIIRAQARLPFEYVKGTENERFAKSAQYTNALFQELKAILTVTETDEYVRKTTTVSTDIIMEKINEILPKPVNITIYKLTEDNLHPKVKGYASPSFTIENKTIYIDGYKIEVPVNNNNKFEFGNCWILLHEFTHIMDYILNPKRTSSMYANIKEIIPKKLYTTHLYNNQKEFNTINKILLNFELNRYLYKLPDKQRVDVLQWIRLALKTEKNAYSNTYKYQAQLDKQLGLNRYIATDEEVLSEYDFDQKLEFINNKLRKTLIKIRKKHAKNIAKKRAAQD